MHACQEGLTVRDALRWAVGALSAQAHETPRLDAELLLAHAMGCTRTQLYARWNECLDAGQAQSYRDLVRRRMVHEPVAYLLGRRAFYDLDQLYVDERVLIPRPESEHLVMAAVAWGRGRPAGLRVADVGTGSGALAIALARGLIDARVWALDLSCAALRVAARNLERYGLRDRVSLVCGDLLTPLAARLDLVVANLPYVRGDEVAHLMPDVARYEPRLALDGGEDGLDVIRRLMPQLAERLCAPGLALLEIDPRQAERVRALARRHLPEAAIDVMADYAGLARVVRVERSAR
ncbi:MAG: peptide chain release factor N(5)-glutamine methyltransferase [Anaerolineae bacterium]|nr:peptide chain release factor N(5)-glutamine methyltransferase [Anaerolineae bacterium]